MSNNAKIPGKTVDITYNEHKLRVNLDMGVGIGGDKWPAQDKFCEFITDAKWKEFFGDLLRDKSCLELGSGNGITGILLDKAFSPDTIVVTDLESHINHIQGNFVLNNTERCKAMALDWKCFETCDVKYDFIFALECVYKVDLFEPLIECIASRSHPHTKTFLGLTRDFGKPLFFALLLKHGFHYRKLSHDVYNVDQKTMGDENVGLFVLYKI